MQKYVRKLQEIEPKRADQGQPNLNADAAKRFILNALDDSAGML